jgi:uncharacterized protein
MSLSTSRRRFLLLLLSCRHLLRRSDRIVVLRRRALVRDRSATGRVLENPEPSVGSLRGVCSGHISHSVRIVSGAEAGASPDLPSGHTILIGGQPVKLPVEPVLRSSRWAFRSSSPLATGAEHDGEWPTLALFGTRPATGGVVDPIFGKPLNFLSVHPAGVAAHLGWLLTLAVITCALAVFFILITGGSACARGRLSRHVTLPWRGFSITFAFLLLVLAMRVYIGRFELLLEDHTIFGGVTYTDAHVTLTGTARRLRGARSRRGDRARQRRAAAARALAGRGDSSGVVCYIAVQMVGWYVSSFIVKPNELVREQPYIATTSNDAAGLRAGQISQREFPAETTVEAADPANNQATLQNIRLWDWHALQDTLRQIQEIRTYYDFPDIDIDRYNIDGTMREVMLARAS